MLPVECWVCILQKAQVSHRWSVEVEERLCKGKEEKRRNLRSETKGRRKNKLKKGCEGKGQEGIEEGDICCIPVWHGKEGHWK